MFIRDKRIGPYTYVYLVETVRENGKIKQRIIKNLGRKEAVLARGDLDRLARSAARLSQRAMILSLIDGAPAVSCRRIGPQLVFERLWREALCRAVVNELAAERRFAFAVERAVFLTVLHRLMVSGSDRSADAWRADYRIEGVADLRLHHLYRAMAWLGAELTEPQAGAALGPRCVKDVIEEELFARRRDLFSDLSVVFMDTTSLYFEGQGGESLGARGYSKDHRPDLNQMILAVVLDQDGRPICSQMWPGNTADVKALLPVVDRLRRRFAIERVCVVADRGTLSAGTVAALEARDLLYILGVRERSDKLVREVVLNDDRPLVPLTLRKRGKDVDYGAKEVKIAGTRYIVCVNHSQAERDAADRAAIVASLEKRLEKGDKALVGNAGYRRFLKREGKGRFAVDRDKVAADARFDGVFVLRTNTDLSPLAAMLRYKQLWAVEHMFRAAKHLLATRPIYHSSDAAIRGHVFCSFLALVLKKELDDRLAQAGLKPEWAEVLRDLDRLQEVEIEHQAKRLILRTPTTGVCGKVFRAVGVALPPNIRDVEPQPATS